MKTKNIYSISITIILILMFSEGISSGQGNTVVGTYFSEIEEDIESEIYELIDIDELTSEQSEEYDYNGELINNEYEISKVFIKDVDAENELSGDTKQQFEYNNIDDSLLYKLDELDSGNASDSSVDASDSSVDTSDSSVDTSDSSVDASNSSVDASDSSNNKDENDFVSNNDYTDITPNGDNNNREFITLTDSDTDEYYYSVLKSMIEDSLNDYDYNMGGGNTNTGSELNTDLILAIKQQFNVDKVFSESINNKEVLFINLRPDANQTLKEKVVDIVDLVLYYVKSLLENNRQYYYIVIGTNIIDNEDTLWYFLISSGVLMKYYNKIVDIDYLLSKINIRKDLPDIF